MVRSTVGAPTLRTCLSAETPSCLLRLCSKVFETCAEQRPARMSLVSCAVTAAFAGSMVLLKMVRPERGRRTPKLVRITLVDCNFSPWSLRTHCCSETVTRTRCREADKVSVSGAPRKRYPQEDEALWCPALLSISCGKAQWPAMVAWDAPGRRFHINKLSNLRFLEL